MSIKQCCALGRCPAAKDLKACSACSEVYYCNREHQVEHFKEGGHKMICPGKKGTPLTFQECTEKAYKYHSTEMWVAALPYYGAMLELTERTAGLFHPQVAKILEAVSTCYRKLSRYEEAIQCTQRIILVMELRNDDSKEKNRELFNVMGHLAELYVCSGNTALAKELLIKTIDLTKETFGGDSFEMGKAMCALAGCFESIGDQDEALTTLQKAVLVNGYANCYEAAELRSSSNAFFNLGVLYRSMKDDLESQNCFAKCLELKLKSGLSEDHPDVLEVKENLM